MIRSMAMHNIDMNYIAFMERWYYKLHGPEIARRYGPWLQRLESWRPVEIPEYAIGFGHKNWLFTQAYWRELPQSGPKGELSFSSPRIGADAYSCFTPPQATEDFKGHEVSPEEKAALRWVQFIRYPEGVDKAAADDWYVNTFAKEACLQAGMYRFFSFRTIPDIGGMPGVWKPDEAQRMAPRRGPLDHRWDRVTEMWYETFVDWKRSIIDDPPVYTVPDWAKRAAYPFATPEEDFISTFLLERPAYNWLDSRHVFL
ncbi:MAG TPA: hypothetical protein VLW86_05785 [Syntrophorhabdales bacterium]|nr:hypothetical protein [Syntrophorhabdales bacterium]